MYTITDVGDIPGKPPLTDAEKQVFVDQWNAQAALAKVYAVPKLLVVERLQAAGKLAAARAALDGAALLLREKWIAATVIMSDNTDALALLQAMPPRPKRHRWKNAMVSRRPARTIAKPHPRPVPAPRRRTVKKMPGCFCPKAAAKRSSAPRSNRASNSLP